jgi:hypothetical protein
MEEALDELMKKEMLLLKQDDSAIEKFRRRKKFTRLKGGSSWFLKKFCTLFKGK